MRIQKNVFKKNSKVVSIIKIDTKEKGNVANNQLNVIVRSCPFKNLEEIISFIFLESITLFFLSINSVSVLLRILKLIITIELKPNQIVGDHMHPGDHYFQAQH